MHCLGSEQNLGGTRVLGAKPLGHVLQRHGDEAAVCVWRSQELEGLRREGVNARVLRQWAADEWRRSLAVSFPAREPPSRTEQVSDGEEGCTGMYVDTEDVEEVLMPLRVSACSCVHAISYGGVDVSIGKRVNDHSQVQSLQLPEKTYAQFCQCFCYIHAPLSPAILHCHAVHHYS